MVANLPTPSPSRSASAPAAACWWRDGLFGLVLVLAALAVYLPLRHAGFIWDDNDNVTENGPLRTWHGLLRIWTELGATQQYYPLTHTSFWIEYHLWGLHALGYHLDNILLHATSAILLWVGLRRLGVPGARLAAALFLLHPVTVESVAWITERKNTLSGVFYLGSLLAALRFWQLGRPGADPTLPPRGNSEATPRAWKYYALTFGLYLCALGGKTAAVPLPAVIVLLIWWRHARVTWRDFWPVLPLVAVGTAMGLVTMWVEKYHLGTMGAEWAFTPAQRVLIAGQALWFYLGKLGWPHPLIFVYPRWVINAASPLQWLATLSAAGGLFALWLGRRGRWRPVFVAAVYFVLLLFPVLGFFNVYYFHYAFVSDHFQYLASLGPLTLAAAGLTIAWRRWGIQSTAPKVIAVGGLLLGLAVLTRAQLPMYGDIETLYHKIIADNPECWLAYTNEGNLLMDRVQVDEAIASYEQALKYNPDYSYAHNDLATALLAKGRVDEAITHLHRAIELQPDYPEAVCNLGNALLAKGQVADAIIQYGHALALRPAMADAHNNLGNALVQQGHIADAVPQYEQAISLQPGNAVTRYALGLALLQLGRTADAIAQYEQALAIRPDYEDAEYSLGGAYLQQGRPAAAIAPLQHALALNPKDHSAHTSLGDALYLTGKPGDAIAEWGRAIVLNPKDQMAETDLAWALATTGQAQWRDGARALTLAQNAVTQGGGGNPLILRSLAAAQAETGHYDQAATTLAQALQLAQQQRNPALTAEMQAQLKVYQSGQPFRDPGVKP